MPDMREHYNKIYRINQNSGSVFGVAGAELVMFLNDHPGEIQTVADLCCGDGRNAIYLAEMGCRVMALDYSAEAIRKIKEKNIKNLAAGVMDLTNMERKLNENFFDLVMCVISFHEIGEDGVEKIISQSKDAAKPGGVVYNAFFIEQVGTYIREGCYYPKPPAIEMQYDGWKILKTKNEVKPHSHITPDSNGKPNGHMHNIYHLFAQKPSQVTSK